MNDFIIGIDLGTTNSVVAYSTNGKTTVIPNKEGKHFTPSIVYYDSSFNSIVGETARRKRIVEPERTIYSIKSLMGKYYSEVESWIENLSFKVVKDSREMAAIKIDDKILTPEEVSAEILKHLAAIATEYSDQPVKLAVITVPAYFDNRQREATIKAGELAGLEVVRLINEPTAAALSYGIDNKESSHIAVFDFGGGTFDISLLKISGEMIEVISTSGDSELGGEDIDEILVDHLKSQIKHSYPDTDLSAISVQIQLQETAKTIKHELSHKDNTDINLPFLSNKNQASVTNFSTLLTRTEFELLVKELFQKLLIPCQQAINDAHLESEQIKKVFLIGGSSKIPYVKELCRELFQQEPSISLNPDESVACGAAIHSEMLLGDLKEILLLDVTPLSLGVEVEGGLFETIVPRNSSIPTMGNKTFTTIQDNQAAVSIHILQGERKLAKDNRTLDRFRLEGIPPAPREVPQIDVSFQIDVNGVLFVKARELSTGREQEIEVKSYRNIAEDFVEKILDEAQSKKMEDEEMVRIAIIKRSVFHLIHETQQQLANNRPYLPAEKSQEWESSLNTSMTELKSFDFEVITNVEKRISDIQKTIQKHLRENSEKVEDELNNK